MQITFPRIEHIDDLWPHLRGREDLEAMFKQRTVAGFTAVNYILMIPDAFGCLLTDADTRTVLLRREARGIKFDPATGRTIARPHPKFFNLDQEAETRSEVLPWRAPHRVVEKLDGSMVHPTPVADGLVWATRMGTMFHEPVTRFIAGQDADIEGFARAMLAEGYTPVFEWCPTDPDARIVIRHTETRLVLTGIRHTLDGTIVDADAVDAEAARWNLEVARTWERNVTDIDAYVDDLRTRRGIEGVVIRWDDSGYAVKVKTDDYRRQHQFLEDIQREDKAIELVLHGGEDDVLPTLDDRDQQALRTFSAAINRAIAAKAAWVDGVLAAHTTEAGLDRKHIATQVAAGLSKFDRAVLLGTMNKGDARKQVLGMLIEPQNQSLKCLKTARTVLDLPSWHALRNAGGDADA